ncbi:protein rds1 [Favolaschia claudopus]|uniref:Protein rds1 n=1 Tax=Favolaschia claudopus TaxID=2862362 RepID=A0AAW0A5B7_9AGAR
MIYSVAVAFLTTLCFSKFTNAAPTRRGVSDPQVLNYALTLEHLESTFYQQGLAKFSASDFKNAGFPDWVRGRFQQISDHEATHVSFLSTALTTAGAEAVAPCEYNFPLTDVHSFVDSSIILEGVGTAAYTGGAQLIDNKGYLTVAASILAVEARHTAWLDAAVNRRNPWNTAFDTPLTPNQVYTLASGFIKSCPTGNARSLPTLTAFPSLTVADDAHPGSSTTLTFNAPASPPQLFAAFISGVGAPVFVPIESGSNKVEVPRDLIGVVYCVVTKDGKRVDDSTTVAGPAILNFGFDSRGQTV